LEPAMSRQKAEDAIDAHGRPFTGKEYLESLRDGREVYIYGERVKDVTAQPAFRNTARSLARLHDALPDPRAADVPTCHAVSGAKVVAPSSALTHYNFLGQNAAVPVSDTDLAVMFIAPMNAPGVKLFCRASYEMTASVMGTPFDYPLSSRFDENDAIFVFENVLIPWEDVLLHRDLDKLKIFFPQSGFLQGYQFQG